MELCQGRRGEMIKMDYLSPERLEMIYRIPLAEIVVAVRSRKGAREAFDDPLC